MKRQRRAPTRRSKEHHFTVVIEPCEEGGYFADCPALPGCHAEGESVDALLIEMRSVIAAYLEDLNDAGEPVPNDEVTVTSLRIAV
jgi:predicted RNase H-like HicB family nuclease